MTDKRPTSPHSGGGGGQAPAAGATSTNSSNVPATSPAPTIRPSGRHQPPSPLGLSGLSTQSYAAAATPHRPTGRGRPGNADFRIPGNSGPQSPRSPGSPGWPIAHRGSVSSTDGDDGAESDSAHATPRNPSYFPPMQGETRRVSEMRGAGGSAMPSGAQSPLPASAAGSLGYGRAPRPKLATTPSANVSRSASRARLPTLKDKDHDEDDELTVTDRGEELIRRRLKERKRAKRERERRLAEEGEEGGAAAGPAQPQPPHSAGTDGSGSIRHGVSPARLITSGSTASQPSGRQRAPSSTRHQPASTRGDVSDTERDPRTERPESIHSLAEEADHQSNLDEVATEGGYRSDSESGQLDDDDSDEASPDDGSDEGVTVKDRQDAINIEHPFGLPIWKPALYRKSRTVTRNAEAALHSFPSSPTESHLLVGNIVWLILFGLWLALACFAAALPVTAVESAAGGRGGYGQTLRGLAWYIVWPFGKYVEGEGAPDDDSSSESTDAPHNDEETSVGYGSTQNDNTPRRALSASTSSSGTVRQGAQTLETLPDEPTTPSTTARTPRRPGVSFAPGCKDAPGGNGEGTSLLGKPFRKHLNRRAKVFGSLMYWPVFFVVVAPTMLFVCVICWFLVVTIPMAKLTWELLQLLYWRPLEINFRASPKVPVYEESRGTSDSTSGDGDADGEGNGEGNGESSGGSPGGYIMRRARLHAGQVAPTGGPTSTVLLCTYRAAGMQYFKYTIGGVNILFINLLPIVFFAIIDGMIILPAVERRHERGQHVPKFMAFVASQALIFVLGLASVIPLSYFIGMAVASISAQSSIGMGAVINATFGSIIEIVLYGIALTQGKGRLVEGSIVGSILAGVLLMPGGSMCSGAFKRKEQKFNAKSAGVTSTMLIMAIIGTLTPTLFYQSYGSFQMHCVGCPDSPDGPVDPAEQWKCNRCWYQHPEPTTDPFYQNRVKILMYACAGILLFSYLIGLWFSLRTHASQIWQNPQQLMQKEVEQLHLPRASLARISPANLNNPILPVHSKPGSIKDGVSPVRHRANHLASPLQGMSPLKSAHTASPRNAQHDLPEQGSSQQQQAGQQQQQAGQQPQHQGEHSGYTPYLQAFEANKQMDGMHLAPPLTQEDFRRAVHTLAAVTAMQRNKAKGEGGAHDEEHGGHEAPSWTRGMSAAVLLSCTVLYAAIAEVLVDVVDVVLKGSGIDEKFLGLTLFALVPNTTEFMNAMSFAINGNIALSMEIGSAYALQVCLLQIPAMVAFSAFYSPAKMGDEVDTFTLIFPTWDVIAIIFSIFLLTYTYIEARSNYHRGSMLVLAYCVLMLGFYFAPAPSEMPDGGPDGEGVPWSLPGVASSLSVAVTKLWA